MGLKSWSARKDPDDIKEYQINWLPRLVDDTISASSWSVVAGEGLVINSNSFTDDKTTVWLSGGTAGVTYEVQNRITTGGNRQYDMTVKLKCERK